MFVRERLKVIGSVTKVSRKCLGSVKQVKRGYWKKFWKKTVQCWGVTTAFAKAWLSEWVTEWVREFVVSREAIASKNVKEVLRKFIESVEIK